MANQVTRRPWKVFVQQIGPTYSFATKERALQRAADLIENENYATVDVYGIDELWFRTRFTFDGPPVVQKLDPDIKPLDWRNVEEA